MTIIPHSKFIVLILPEPLVSYQTQTVQRFYSMDSIFTKPRQPLKQMLGQQFNIPLQCNLLWIETHKKDSGLWGEEPAFGRHWMQYISLSYSLFVNYILEEICNCSRHNGLEIASTTRWVPAAATRSKSIPVPLIVVTALFMTCSEINQYNSHY